MQAFQSTSLHPVLAAAMTADRLGASVAAVIGLLAVITGVMAMARSSRRSRAGAGARTIGGIDKSTAAMVLGGIGTVLGGVFVATADGGPGTGNGIVGAILAMVLGLTGVVLGGLTRARRGAPA
ncbi:MAG TPA: DUF6223 family protein [Iamia sp.]|nr:DUF6223 family protein [Iamia sp.]